MANIHAMRRLRHTSGACAVADSGCMALLQKDSSLLVSFMRPSHFSGLTLACIIHSGQSRAVQNLIKNPNALNLSFAAPLGSSPFSGVTQLVYPLGTLLCVRA